MEIVSTNLFWGHGPMELDVEFCDHGYKFGDGVFRIIPTNGVCFIVALARASAPVSKRI